MVVLMKRKRKQTASSTDNRHLAEQVPAVMRMIQAYTLLTGDDQNKKMAALLALASAMLAAGCG